MPRTARLTQTRRKIQVLCCGEMQALRDKLRGGPLKVGVYLFAGYELLDTYGPLELLAVANQEAKLKFDIVLVGPGTTPGAPDVLTHFEVDDGSIPAFDVLLLPGGDVRVPLEPTARDWLVRATQEADVVLSVCNAAAMLADIGLLDGRPATTNKIELPELQSRFPAVKWRRGARWVIDGAIWTSSGVSAGTDMTAQFLHDLLGTKSAKLALEAAEWSWISDPDNDPFVENARVDWASVKPHANTDFPSLTVGVLLFDNFEMLDTFGPLEMFAVANRFQPDLLKVTTYCEFGQVKSSFGPHFNADVAPLPDEIPAFDLLLIPGGIGSLREMHNPAAIEWTRRAAEKARMVMTVCSGAAALAQTGLLDGKRATTNKLVYNLLSGFRPAVKWQPEARFVQDGKFWTSSGVSAGTDLALHLLGELYGPQFADAVANRAEFVRTRDGTTDPFASSIPADTYGSRAKNAAIRLLLPLVFRVGGMFGFDMKTSTLLREK